MLRKRASSTRVARKCPANEKIFAVLLCSGYVRSESRPWEKRVITTFLYMRILPVVDSSLPLVGRSSEATAS